MATLDSSMDYVAGIQNLVNEKDGDKIVDSLFDNNNKDIVRFCGMELVSVLSLPLQDATLFHCHPILWEQFESALEYLVRTCKAKEMLLSLLEQAEIMKNDRVFKLLTRLLRTVFIRVPERRGDTLLWALSRILGYIQSLALPQYNPELTESQASVISENCPISNRLLAILQCCLHFIHPFISEALHCSRATDNCHSRSHQILALSTFLLQLLDRPVSSFHISLPEDKPFYRNDFRLAVIRLVDYLNQLAPFSFVTLNSWFNCKKLCFECSLIDDSKSQMQASGTSIGVFCYVLFVQNIGMQCVPYVYTGKYVLYTLMDYCIEMMNSTRANMQYKGVSLLRSLQERMKTSWAADMLNEPKLENLFSTLIHCMNYCSSETTRKSAVESFDHHLGSFPPQNRVRAIQMIFQRVAHSQVGWSFPRLGILGHLIDAYRQWLLGEASNPNSIYTQTLPSLLSMFCDLPDGETTDLLHNMEQINASLCLLQSIALTNSQCIHTDAVHKMVKISFEKFVNPLWRALDLSEANFKMEMKNRGEVNEVHASDAKNLMEESMLNEALCRFQLIRCNLAMVQDLWKSKIDV